MRRALAWGLLFLPVATSPLCGASQPTTAAPHQVVDRIVARVEDDIITLSEMHELAAYQQLVEGQSEPEPGLLDKLIEQWALGNEAQAAQFPPPSDADVNRELEAIESRFPSPQAYAERLMAVWLTPEGVRRMVAKQVYLARFLDYRFRAAIQVEEYAIAQYYSEKLVPALAARQQAVPPLEAVSGQIREVLVEQAISERAAVWFEETKLRLRIEIAPEMKATFGEKP